MKNNKPLVGIIMGSDSDLPTMQEAVSILGQFGVPYEMKIISAHRSPDVVSSYAKKAFRRGLRVIIAGAGGAAHLAGVTASHTPLPVIGIPIMTKSMDGLDSLLSIVQMPGGIPVATVAVGGGKNAGLLAVQILSVHYPELAEKMIRFKKELKRESLKKNLILTHKK
jgi:5-(carboxyamino)imidazole ribonucleotide mutase